MNILMLQAPTAERDGSVPFGLLYAASAAQRAGHAVRIMDLDRQPLSYDDVREAVAGFRPGLIGIGGITSAYPACKRLIAQLKSEFPQLPVVVGGVISSVADLLLERAGADVVVHGEAETIFPPLIAALTSGAPLSGVPGISYREEGVLRRTPQAPAVAQLDSIPMPDFELLDMPRYLEPAEPWLDHYFGAEAERRADIARRLGDNSRIFPIITARGCTHRCIFCYRHHKGLRQHSPAFVIDMMRQLRDRYGVGIFQINDELTTANRRWVDKFCSALRDAALDVHYIVLSSRVDNVDEEMLTALRDTGCLMINYGYESGSDTILREIRKGVTREQALTAARLTRQVGLKNVPEIMIGFPSETQETVAETIDFLKQIDSWPISINTPIPFPETPLWDIGRQRGLIGDKEEFILGYRRERLVNFTRLSDTQLRLRVRHVLTEVEAAWLTRRGRRWESLWCRLRGVAAQLARILVPAGAYSTLRRLLRPRPG